MTALAARGRVRNRRWFGLAARVVTILMVALVGGVLVATTVDARLTNSALAAESRRRARSEVEALARSVGQELNNVAGVLRGRTRDRPFRDAIVEGQGRELLRQLTELSQDFSFEGMRLETLATGRLFEVGDVIADLPPGMSGSDQTLLWTFRDGRTALLWVEHLTESGAVLVAARPFGAAEAEDLRGLSRRDVILVADRAVVGATFTRDDDTPPGMGADGALPTGEQLIEVDGEPSFVAYATISTGSPDLGLQGAVGVAIADPTATLNEALGRSRVIGLGLLVAAAIALASILVRTLTRPARELAETAQHVAGGDLDATFAGLPGGELGDLAEALDLMRRTLQEQVGIMAEQADLLQQASERLVNIRDEDRRRLSQALHDGLQQRLVLLRMRVQSIAAEDFDEGRKDLSEEVRALLVELREFSHDLYPSILRDRGLAGALRSLAARAPMRVAITFAPEPLPRIPADLEANAYFLAAEAITNALKYAEATELTVAVKVCDEAVELTVADNGHGFDLDQQPSGAGMVNMRDRALAFGGHCEVTTGPAGTTVSASFPFSGASGPLQEQQDGGHASVEVIGVREP